MILLNPIGYFHNACPESCAPESIRREVSEIELLPEYADGLQAVEQCAYLDVVFAFHREESAELLTRLRTGETVGVFASRSPRRPNRLGITTVRLLRRDGCRLWVTGADALDGSPVVDIKCCDTSVLQRPEVDDSLRLFSPRADVIRCIQAGDTRELLLSAARLHGHLCPGLALGVLGATEAMRRLLDSGENPQDYTLTVEMRNCAVDGALFVTGCTPGTRRFVMNDADNDCFYLTNSAGKGWKVTLLPENRDYIAHLPSNLSPAEKALAVVAAVVAPTTPQTKLWSVESVGSGGSL